MGTSARTRPERIGESTKATKALRPPVASAVTGDREYSEAESEFLRACLAYRDEFKKPWLESCDYFYIMTRRLGYSKPGPGGDA